MPDNKESVKESDHTKQNLSARGRRATGPRSPAGKRRSRYNAVKNGLFARTIPLSGESAAEYEALIKSLWNEHELETGSETEDFAYLVGLFWRRRRGMKAEDAVITRDLVSNRLSQQRALVKEAWDQSRAGETTGGSLRNSSNPLILEEAIAVLTAYHNALERNGFSVELDKQPLRNLYGINHDGTASTGFFRTFEVILALGMQTPTDEKDPKELKELMLRAIDNEIERLKTLSVMEEAFTKTKTLFDTMTALIASSDAMDVIMRVQGHTSREIVRTMSRLEPARRRRQGRPEPSTLRLKFDG